VTSPRLRRIAAGLAPILLLALGACADTDQDVFSPEGDKARAINDLQVPVFIVAGIVGVLVAVLLTMAIVRGRRRFKDGSEEPEQIEGNFQREIAWTIAPAVLLLIISIFTVATLLRLDDADALPADLESMEITVYGQQWWWGYEYDLDGDGEVEIITANELVIPAGVDLTLNVTSRDVIHSFWVPSLNGTRDAVPGRMHTIVLNADEPGEFHGQCKEFCGLSHANMYLRVVALSSSDFQTWIEQQQQTQPMLAEGDPGYDGQQLFLARCAACHQINGLEDADGQPLEVEGNATVVSGHAPNLTHLMSRETFAGAMFDLYDPDTGAFNRSQLEAWLRNPPAEKPMYTDIEEGEEYRGMPDLGLTEEEIDQLIDYLTTLGPVPPSPDGPTPTNDEAGS
jgi:cytochrome c oxidase subunit 2